LSPFRLPPRSALFPYTTLFRSRQLYDGTIVPANYPLDEDERERRLERYYRPYHDAAGSLIASVAAASGAAPFVFSVHSFTPSMRSEEHTSELQSRENLVCRLLL